MRTGLKPAGKVWGWKESPGSGAGFGRNYVNAGWVRVEIVTPRGGDRAIS